MSEQSVGNNLKVAARLLAMCSHLASSYANGGKAPGQGSLHGCLPNEYQEVAAAGLRALPGPLLCLAFQVAPYTRVSLRLQAVYGIMEWCLVEASALLVAMRLHEDAVGGMAAWLAMLPLRMALCYLLPTWLAWRREQAGTCSLEAGASGCKGSPFLESASAAPCTDEAELRMGGACACKGADMQGGADSDVSVAAQRDADAPGTEVLACRQAARSNAAAAAAAAAAQTAEAAGPAPLAVQDCHRAERDRSPAFGGEQEDTEEDCKSSLFLANQCSGSSSGDSSRRNSLTTDTPASPESSLAAQRSPSAVSLPHQPSWHGKSQGQAQAGAAATKMQLSLGAQDCCGGDCGQARNGMHTGTSATVVPGAIHSGSSRNSAFEQGAQANSECRTLHTAMAAGTAANAVDDVAGGDAMKGVTLRGSGGLWASYHNLQAHVQQSDLVAAVAASTAAIASRGLCHGDRSHTPLLKSLTALDQAAPSSLVRPPVSLPVLVSSAQELAAAGTLDVVDCNKGNGSNAEAVAAAVASATLVDEEPPAPPAPRALAHSDSYNQGKLCAEDAAMIASALAALSGANVSGTAVTCTKNTEETSRLAVLEQRAPKSLPEMSVLGKAAAAPTMQSDDGIAAVAGVKPARSDPQLKKLRVLHDSSHSDFYGNGVVCGSGGSACLPALAPTDLMTFGSKLSSQLTGSALSPSLLSPCHTVPEMLPLLLSAPSVSCGYTSSSDASATYGSSAVLAPNRLLLATEPAMAAADAAATGQGVDVLLDSPTAATAAAEVPAGSAPPPEKNVAARATEAGSTVAYPVGTAAAEVPGVTEPAAIAAHEDTAAVLPVAVLPQLQPQAQAPAVQPVTGLVLRSERLNASLAMAKGAGAAVALGAAGAQAHTAAAADVPLPSSSSGAPAAGSALARAIDAAMHTYGAQALAARPAATAAAVNGGGAVAPVLSYKRRTNVQLVSVKVRDHTGLSFNDAAHKLMTSLHGAAAPPPDAAGHSMHRVDGVTAVPGGLLLTRTVCVPGCVQLLSVSLFLPGATPRALPAAPAGATLVGPDAAAAAVAASHASHLLDSAAATVAVGNEPSHAMHVTDANTEGLVGRVASMLASADAAHCGTASSSGWHAALCALGLPSDAYTPVGADILHAEVRDFEDLDSVLARANATAAATAAARFAAAAAGGAPARHGSVMGVQRAHAATRLPSRLAPTAIEAAATITPAAATAHLLRLGGVRESQDVCQRDQQLTQQLLRRQPCLGAHHAATATPHLHFEEQWVYDSSCEIDPADVAQPQDLAAASTAPAAPTPSDNPCVPAFACPATIACCSGKTNGDADGGSPANGMAVASEGEGGSASLKVWIAPDLAAACEGCVRVVAVSMRCVLGDSADMAPAATDPAAGYSGDADEAVWLGSDAQDVPLLDEHYTVDAYGWAEFLLPKPHMPGPVCLHLLPPNDPAEHAAAHQQHRRNHTATDSASGLLMTTERRRSFTAAANGLIGGSVADDGSSSAAVLETRALSTEPCTPIAVPGEVSKSALPEGHGDNTILGGVQDAPAAPARLQQQRQPTLPVLQHAPLATLTVVAAPTPAIAAELSMLQVDMEVQLAAQLQPGGSAEAGIVPGVGADGGVLADEATAIASDALASDCGMRCAAYIEHFQPFANDLACVLAGLHHLQCMQKQQQRWQQQQQVGAVARDAGVSDSHPPSVFALAPSPMAMRLWDALCDLSEGIIPFLDSTGTVLCSAYLRQTLQALSQSLLLPLPPVAATDPTPATAMAAAVGQQQQVTAPGVNARSETEVLGQHQSQHGDHAPLHHPSEEALVLPPGSSCSSVTKSGGSRSAIARLLDCERGPFTVPEVESEVEQEHQEQAASHPGMAQADAVTPKAVGGDGGSRDIMNGGVACTVAGSGNADCAGADGLDVDELDLYDSFEAYVEGQGLLATTAFEQPPATAVAAEPSAAIAAATSVEALASHGAASTLTDEAVADQCCGISRGNFVAIGPCSAPPFVCKAPVAMHPRSAPQQLPRMQLVDQPALVSPRFAAAIGKSMFACGPVNEGSRHNGGRRRHQRRFSTYGGVLGTMDDLVLSDGMLNGTDEPAEILAALTAMETVDGASGYSSGSAPLLCDAPSMRTSSGGDCGSGELRDANGDSHNEVSLAPKATGGSKEIGGGAYERCFSLPVTQPFLLLDGAGQGSDLGAMAVAAANGLFDARMHWLAAPLSAEDRLCAHASTLRRSCSSGNVLLPGGMARAGSSGGAPPLTGDEAGEGPQQAGSQGGGFGLEHQKAYIAISSASSCSISSSTSSGRARSSLAKACALIGGSGALACGMVVQHVATAAATDASSTQCPADACVSLPPPSVTVSERVPAQGKVAAAGGNGEACPTLVRATAGMCATAPHKQQGSCCTGSTEGRPGDTNSCNSREHQAAAAGHHAAVGGASVGCDAAGSCAGSVGMPRALLQAALLLASLAVLWTALSGYLPSCPVGH